MSIRFDGSSFEITKSDVDVDFSLFGFEMNELLNADNLVKFFDTIYNHAKNLENNAINNASTTTQATTQRDSTTQLDQQSTPQ